MEGAAPPHLAELDRLVGREEHLDHVHGALRRAAQAVREVIEHGTCLVTCSDEFQGELRRNFDRDVARPLLPHHQSRTFAVSNMGGRVEPGALALADQHFTVRTRSEGAKLLLVEIAAHVGRRLDHGRVVWGELSRFGLPSPCCGALCLLLDPPAAAAGVRHPWFDQLSAFFGPQRLDELRAAEPGMRLVSAAIVHAVLQAESALSDLLRSPPPTPTHVLLVPLVVVNQRGSDGAIVCGYHHLLSDGREVHVQHGGALRSTPSSHRFEMQAGTLVVRSPWEEDVQPTPAAAAPLEAQLPELPFDPLPAPAGGAPAPRKLPPADLPPEAASLVRDAAQHAERPEVRELLQRTRARSERLAQHPHAWRVYARPMLRGLVQALSVVAPELGLAAFVLEGAGEAARSRRLRRLLSTGPTGPEARALLHDLEPELQQLGHRQAREVLESLLARYG